MAAIAGSAPASQVYAVGCCNGTGPLATDNGILFTGSTTALSQVRDGTSNTWLIGEQSNHLLDAQGIAVTTNFGAGVGNSGGIYGWIMGAANPLPEGMGRRRPRPG